MKLISSSVLKLVSHYVCYLVKPSYLPCSYKAPAFVLLPLQSHISLGIFTAQIFIMQKAFFDFTTRLSFSYLRVLIGGSIRFRLIILLVFLLLIWCDVNHDTARSCVLLGVFAYYVYMLRNVKFNMFSWLYTLTSLCLALSVIITFWLLLSLFIPYIIIFCNIDFPHGYDLSINPTNPDNSGGNTPGKAGGPVGGDNQAGGSGGAGGSGQPGGSDPNSQSTLMQKGKSPLEDKDKKELEKVEERIAEIKGKLESLRKHCLEKRNLDEWASSEYLQARKLLHEVSDDTVLVDDPIQEGSVPSGHLEHVYRYHTDEYQEALQSFREWAILLEGTHEDFEQAENALRKTSDIRIELAEAENKRSSLVEQSKKK